ncbi:hypothetical protein GA0070621_1038 [Micromonospora narathiwatensis]|uniref:Uncharacterized protein n=2 Tax=Micromonospora narathiwatensis TaxID=299146 RepID=A0A1A8ZA32_9ACTN|nr:hypothetical protein GA0070621_1038 [Micromonospora narathiwatensis]
MGDHEKVSDHDPFDLSNLAQIIDTYMHRILDSGEDPVDVLLNLMGALIEPPLSEHLWCVGQLYGNFGWLSDIVDGYPVDYGANAETIAAREIRDAARDWLGIPRTVEGMEHYLKRWEARLEALPATYGGWTVRGTSGHEADLPPTNA